MAISLAGPLLSDTESIPPSMELVPMSMEREAQRLRQTPTTTATGMAFLPTATPLLVPVASPLHGPPPLVLASRALFTAPVERGVLMLTPMLKLTTATTDMASATALLTMVATLPLTPIGLPKDSARGVLMPTPTTATVLF